MPYRDFEPFSKQLTIVVGLTVVGIMAFGLTLSFYRNALFEQTLLEIAMQNQKLRDETRRSQDDLEYFRSAQYKDKYAKEYLAKLNPGEKILVITDLPRTIPITQAEVLSDEQRKEELYQELLRQMPVLEHWKLYLFRRGGVEALRKNL